MKILTLNKGGPPKSRRHCINCNKTTKFAYNRNLLHSECTECGWRHVKW